MDGTNHTAMCRFMCHQVWTCVWRMCVFWHIEGLHFYSLSIRAIVFHIRKDHTFNWRPLTMHVQCATKIRFLPILKCGITLIRRWTSFDGSPLVTRQWVCSLFICIKLIWILNSIIVMRSNDCQNQYPLWNRIDFCASSVTAYLYLRLAAPLSRISFISPNFVAMNASLNSLTITIRHIKRKEKPNSRQQMQQHEWCVKVLSHCWCDVGRCVQLNPMNLVKSSQILKSKIMTDFSTCHLQQTILMMIKFFEELLTQIWVNRRIPRHTPQSERSIRYERAHFSSLCRNCIECAIMAWILKEATASGCRANGNFIAGDLSLRCPQNSMTTFRWMEQKQLPAYLDLRRFASPFSREVARGASKLIGTCPCRWHWLTHCYCRR